jgi:hypothetical protein
MGVPEEPPAGGEIGRWYERVEQGARALAAACEPEELLQLRVILDNFIAKGEMKLNRDLPRVALWDHMCDRALGMQGREKDASRKKG